MSSTDLTSLFARAAALDAADELVTFRDRFVVDEDIIYLDGNSLGRLPRETASRIAETITNGWGRRLVTGWNEWLGLGQTVGDVLAPLLGAKVGEVAVADQTSINLYKLASAALEATGRSDIITDSGNFPSDRYILESVAAGAGGRLVLAPEDPTLADLEELLSDDVALVSLSHVSYRSGAMADGAAITELAHRNGALMLWDLAHSAGSVPVHLTTWNADLAVGCTYKYLNGGPGAPGFLFVRSDLHETLTQPIKGWFGHDDQFGFSDKWSPAGDIRRFLVGTPPIVSMIGAQVGIELTAEAGINAIRAKSTALTTLFIDAVRPLEPHGISIVTPEDPALRGSHITLRHRNGYQIATALRDAGVIPDFRSPDLVRFGFAPLYTTYFETVRAVEMLTELLDTESYLSVPPKRRGVT